MTTSAQPELQVGDTVTIATGTYPLTWTIRAIYSKAQGCGVDGPLAQLESGQTQRLRYEPLINLTHFNPTKRNTQ